MRATVAFRQDATALTRTRVADYLELTKPRIAVMVLLTALVGFFLGSPGGMAIATLLHALIGTALVAGGASAMNQFLERDLDARMRRTEKRPVPAGRLLPGEALAFGLTLVLAGVIQLALFTTLLASLLALGTAVAYVLLYTPLKRVTSLATAVGAVPGAMPPLIGWAAASGGLAREGWLLFAILALWQLPHFLAISWIYREDYSRAGLPVLAATDPEGAATGRHILGYSILLLAVSLLPFLLGVAGTVYLGGALVLGMAMLASGIRAAVRITTAGARLVFLTSLVYIPAIFLLLVVDRV